MNRKIFSIVFVVILATLLFPGTALAKNLQDDRIVVGETFTLSSGEVFDGNLFVFGGAANLEQDSRLNGDVIVLGGSARIDGRVDGNVILLGGSVRLGSTAWIRGNVTALATSIDDENARIDGQLITGRTVRVWDFPRVITPDGTQPFDGRVFPSWDILRLFFRSFLWAVLAVLVAMFLPTPTDRVARTIVAQPLLSAGLGLLTAIVAPILLVVIAITIILIPVSLLGGFVLVIIWFFGRVALGLEIGRRLASVFQKDWPLAVTAGIGTFFLVIVVDGANMVIPCVGGIFSVLVSLLGLGGVLLSRFGSQIYNPTTVPVIPPPPSEPPTVQDTDVESPQDQGN